MTGPGASSCRLNISPWLEAVVIGGGKILLPPQDRPGEPIILAEVVDTEGNGFMLSQNKETEEG